MRALCSQRAERTPHVKANYLASPPLVVAYSLAGTVNVDMTKDPISKSASGDDIYLKDIWPSNKEIQEIVEKHVSPKMFSEQYSNALEGPSEWKHIQTSDGNLYDWNSQSTYVQQPSLTGDW